MIEPAAAPSMDWQPHLDGTASTLQNTAIRDLLRLVDQKHVISLAGGLPAPELFPVEELRRAYDQALAEDGRNALQYGPTQGYQPLRNHIADVILAGRGIRCTGDDLMITSGSQQALYLAARTLVAPGAPVLVEHPTYMGAINSLVTRNPQWVPLEIDAEGLIPEQVEAWLRTYDGKLRPVLYTIPSFQNPSGVTMSLERRHALLAVANRHQLAIIEDDPYSALAYDQEMLPPLRALPGGENVIFCGTFSKTMAPGPRNAWVVAPPPVLERLILVKQSVDMQVDSLSQRAVYRYLVNNDTEAHVEKLKALYRTRRDAMLEALEELMPEGARWNRPAGGMFVWIELPDGIDTRELLGEAVREGVGYVPGSACMVDGSGANTLRLSFVTNQPETIWEGVSRLRRVLDRAYARN